MPKVRKIRLRKDLEWERYNNFLTRESIDNVRIVAVETGQTIQAAMDWIIRKGLRKYLEERDEHEKKRAQS